MSEQVRNGKPRKILGNSNGSSTANATLNLNCPTAALKFSANNDANTSHALQQQQMERLRLTNMIGQQEMHALWPYGTTTFLSPMLPTPNMALPYALTGTLPYAAVPIYQQLPNGAPQQCTVSPVSSSSSASSSVGNQSGQIQQQQALRSNLPTLSSTNNGGASSANNCASNDSNKINIQIGLQCVSQNAPLNINSMSDSLSKVNFLNLCNPSASMGGEKDCKESASSLRSSPILLAADDTAAGGDASNLHLTGCNGGGTVTLSQAKFNELTRLALRGSEIAEKLAYTHRNRPCFKKIDSLCARMKQDLIRPDGVLANINSQGIAWAVKDFIFVFTRVINAWIIIKGYVYNTPEGLNKVKAALSPEFAASFVAWQDTTMDFIENLIKSFVSLDNLVQSQKNVYQKADSMATACNNSNNNNSNTPVKLMPIVNTLLDDSFDILNNPFEKSAHNNSSLNKNYIYTMVKDSEGSQRQATVNGTYFQTGTYNPIKKDSPLAEQSVHVANGMIAVRPVANALTPPQLFTGVNSSPLEQYTGEQLTEFWPSAGELDPATAAAITAAAASSEYLKIREKIPPSWLNYDLSVLEKNLSELSHGCDGTAAAGLHRPGNKEKLNLMLDRLMSMQHADMFFRQHFSKNYFPDFISKHKNDFIDVRSIILKCEDGGYQHIFEMVHDVKKIIYLGKEFLKVIVQKTTRSEMHHHHPHTTSSAAATNATPQATHPPTQRRRKKRPNYGTRTVEVRRGYSGFGFTISGQQPCRLSCIIPNSPADQAGLRAGDFLISVNGLNVSKLPHETVVQLIGNSFGSIRMQIAEHYYSDSTDEENAAAALGIPSLPCMGPSRPRYVYHKTKQQRLRHHLPQRKLQESLLPLPRAGTQQTAKKYAVPLKKQISAVECTSSAAPKRSVSEELKSVVSSPSHASAMANVRAMMVRAPLSAALEYRAIVGYLGTIEMPKQIAHSSKLQTVRSCIRKLRQEKRQPSMVLMIILPDCLKLQSNNGNILATYASARLNYVSSSSESENRFFGLVTSAVYSPQLDECEEDEGDHEEDATLRANATASAVSSADNNVIISNSCHVFVVDTKLCEHQQHLVKAQEFRIECTKDPISSLCLEFPNNSEYVVNLIRSMYTMRIVPPAAAQRSISDDPNLHMGGRNNGTAAAAAHSPQPSNHSEVSTTTSNSDSGIGYNNDCSNITDRIVVVDFPHNARETRHGCGGDVIQVTNRPHNICQQNIIADEESPSTSTTASNNKRLASVRVIADPKMAYHLTSPCRSLMASRSCDDVLNLIEQETEEFNDPAAVTQQCYASMDDISLHTASMDNEESHKFQPPNPKSIALDSIESETVEKSTEMKAPKPLKLNVDAWNSLQDIKEEVGKESSPTKLSSTPDLSRHEEDGNMSPFERGWIQTSLRTPRADKHTINFSLSQEDKQQYPPQQQQNQYKSPSISRSASMSNSERGSFKSKLPLKDKSKTVKKGPTAWGTCIESLLSDAAGIKTFAEFLKLEYAAENIYFWTACERFRNVENHEERQTAALNIYKKHLSNGSMEPVNVDSQARSLVERNLLSAERDLFHPAQKQIFNLMKFDSYQRFLRSDLYKQCLLAEKKGKSLPFTGDNLDDLLKTTNFSESASSKLKKSASNAEEGRPRRSLLPWHRKTRSKSRDQIAQENQDPQPAHAATISTTAKPSGSGPCSLKPNAIHGSASSLTSFDAITFSNNLTPNDLNCALCRIKFPDGATTIVQLKMTETVGQLVERLMEKRSIRYQFFDVCIKGPPIKSVDLKASVQQLAGKEVEIEQRVAFKLDLPTPKGISVRSKPRKQLYEVVRPILQRYNINPEIVDVLMRETQEKVDLTLLVTSVNEQRLQVVYKAKTPTQLQDTPHRKAPLIPKNSIVEGLQTTQTTLDEITNKVFSDLMQVKQNQSSNGQAKPKFDQCSLKSDECPSETSSFFKIRRGKRDSLNAGLRNNKHKKINTQISPVTSPDNKNPMNKIKTGVKLQLPAKVVEKQDDLLEDLKRAQLARLEDQRGTEINSELPEFLKNTDNANKSASSSPSTLSPLSAANNDNIVSSASLPQERPPQPAPRLSIANKLKSTSTSPMKIDDDHHHDQRSLTDDSEDVFNTPSKGPPPLPPKPKVLPIKPSNWGVNMSSSQLGVTKMSPTTLLPSPTPTIASPQLTNANVVAVSASNNSSPSARCAYLDQPSSSFV